MATRIAASLEGAAINLNELRDDGRQELLEVLETLAGRCALVLDGQLGGLLNHVILEGSRLLKEHGVAFFRELRAEPDELFLGGGGDSMPDHILYLVRPSIPHMQKIASQVKAYLAVGTNCRFHVCFVPHRTVVCEQILEDEDILDQVEIGEYQLGLIPFDQDVLSLELDASFKQCYVDGDTSSINCVARALHKLQLLYGVIPNVKSKGAAAKKVLQKLMRLRRDDPGDDGAGADGALASSSSAAGTLGGGDSGWSGAAAGLSDGLAGVTAAGSGDTGAGAGAGGGMDGGNVRMFSDIDTMIVIDREVDLVSPLVTPLTYEGLIDELIGIENGRVKLRASLLQDDSNDEMSRAAADAAAAATRGGAGGAEAAAAAAAASDAAAAAAAAGPRHNPDDLVPVPLNSDDRTYHETRDLNIERLGAYLQEKAIFIKQTYSSFRDNKDASITEIHDFVKRMPALAKDYKSLTQHIHIAELVRRTTGSATFREQWQNERSMLEGETSYEFIEDLLSVGNKRDLYRILRLMCLQSLTAGGIRSNKFDALRRDIVQIFGYEYLFTLSNLERAGLLRRREVSWVDAGGGTAWSHLRRQLRLIVDDVDTTNPTDIAYVSSGYAPLSVRIVENAVRPGGWTEVQDILKLLPGPSFEFTQTRDAETLEEALSASGGEKGGGASAASTAGTTAATLSGSASGSASGAASTSSSSSGTSSLSLSGSASAGGGGGGGGSSGGAGGAGSELATETGKRVLFVFYVGGVTHMEIAALRWLSRQPGFPYSILIGTTKLINGNTLVKTLVAGVDNRLTR